MNINKGLSNENIDPRLKEIKDQIKKFTQLNFQHLLPVSGKNDALDIIISDLNKLGEALSAFGLSTQEDQNRIIELEDTILKIALGNYSHKAKISEKADFIDALALALNTLSEELSSNEQAISKDKRINNILEVLLQYTKMEFSEKIPVGDTGDEIDAIAVGLNTLSEELQAKVVYIRENEKRVNEILEALLGYTMMDFSRKLHVTEAGDELDAIALGLNTLTEELESNIHKVKEAEERVRLLIESVKDYAIIMLDPEGNIISWNSGAEHIKGYKANEIIGKHMSVFYTPDELQNDEPRRNLKIAIEKGRHETEGWRVRKDGTTFWADIVFNPLYDDNSHLKGFSKVTRDITDRKNAEEQINRKNWILTGITELNNSLRGEKESADLAQDVINKLADYLNVQVGAFYFSENDDNLKFISGYAYSKESHFPGKIIKKGEGLVGQVFLEKKIKRITKIPPNYIKINSGLGDISPKEIIITPLLFDDKIMGVIELGSMEGFSDMHLELLDLVTENIAIAIHSTMARIKMQELYSQTQQQAEELESQQEELRQTNEELTRQSEMLQSSEEELRMQQEELKQVNVELEEKAQLLEEKNIAIEQAKEAIKLKAEEVELTSKYKSEFLANMSHELRTPLNSLLILAKLLSDNKNKNLTDKQLEYTNVIYKAGNDLLTLINDILDLSKIEAGKVELSFEEVKISSIENDIHALFDEVAIDKGINFELKLDKDVPETIYSDKIRLEQIIRNLLSNAFKFTAKGGKVKLSFSLAPTSKQFKNEKMYKARKVWEISVSDTGLGIAPDKQKLIFEAFQQADGSTNRKYGGTGLGLSISRELVNILNGEIQLESEVDKGSVFTVFFPVEAPSAHQERQSHITNIENEEIARSDYKNIIHNLEPTTYQSNEIPDDREQLIPEDKIILIIEDDKNFARILIDFAHEHKYKAIVAVQGDTGLSYASIYSPHAIILDMQLPVLDGWTVLKKLKEDENLNTIPVHIMSVIDKQKLGLEMGAMAYLKKPVNKDDLDHAFQNITNYLSPQLKKVLIVEDNQEEIESISQLLKSREYNLKCDSAIGGKAAFKKLLQNHFDCVVFNFNMKDSSDFDLLEKIKSNKNLNKIPVIVHANKTLTPEEEKKLKKYSSAIIIKGSKSYERLLDETALFLNKVDEGQQPEKKKNSNATKMEDLLNNKIVLLTDDDMRNVFALTTVLEDQGMQVISAGDGKEALTKFDENEKIDIVLMDIMMPEMDGYQAMQAIRKHDKYKNIPILALTAKAMQGDREKCIAAGASDYISKPINIEQLLSLMRVWLYK